MEILLNRYTSVFDKIDPKYIIEFYLYYFSRNGYIPRYNATISIPSESLMLNPALFGLYIDFEKARIAETIYNDSVINAIKKQNYTIAEYYLKDILDFCPQYIAAIRALVKIALIRKDIEQAFDWCIEGLKLYPKDIDLLNQMAYIFKIKDMEYVSYEYDDTILSIADFLPIDDLTEYRRVELKTNIEPIEPLFSRRQKFKNTNDDILFFANILSIRDIGHDYEFAYEFILAWHKTLNWERKVGKEAQNLLYNICQRFDKEEYILTMASMLFRTNHKYNLKIRLAGDTNLSKAAIFDENTKTIYYNRQKPFAQFEVMKLIIKLRLCNSNKINEKYESESNKAFFNYLIKENKEIIQAIFSLYVNNYYFYVIKDKALDRVALYYIYSKYMRLRPLIIGYLLHSLHDMNTITKEIKDMAGCCDLYLKPMLISNLTDIYLLEKLYEITIEIDYCCRVKEFDTAEINAEALRENQSNYFKNPYLHVKDTFMNMWQDDYFPDDFLLKSDEIE